MENLQFKTNVQLKSIIGKDLINDDNIAILELVKNAYDANSPKALIIFKNIKDNDDEELEQHTKTKSKVNLPYTEKTSRIVIQDFGVGMDKTDIKEKWLNIAYSEKKAQKKKYDRILAGAKGVGRFSCDRLGEYLNLYSRKTNGIIVHLFIDWKLFEVENKKDLLIQNIDVVFNEIRPSEFKRNTGYDLFKKGTLLEIIKLRSNWTHKEKAKAEVKWSVDKLLDLKKQLERLINPNQAYTDNEFQIIIRSEEFAQEDKNTSENKRINGEVKNKVFESLNFRTTSITSQIDSTGKEINTILQDKGKTIFKLVEKNVRYPKLSNVTVVIYFLNPYSKAYFMKQTGIRSVEFGSIYFFINGFRIPPYGDEGDDWLKLEIRKGQGHSRFFSTRDIVGRIEVLDEKGLFQIISSREGVVKNANYHQLTDTDGYFFKTFRRLERYVRDGIAWDQLPDYLKNKIGEIEAKVLSSDWDVDDEIFVESDFKKFKRVYDLIHSIIGARYDEVISLYVNEEIILQKVAEEREIAEREFEKLLDDFSNKRIDVDVISRVLGEKAKLNEALQKQIKEFSKYSTEEATTKAILELESLRELSKKQEEQIKELLKKVEDLQKEKKKKEKESKGKDKIILFQQRLITKDVQALIDFHHTIGISADAIDKHLINLKDDLQKGKIPTKEDLFELIEDVSYESKKIIAITNLATAANFNADADIITSDFVEFIKQYAEKVSFGILRTYDGSKKIKITVNANEDLEFIYRFKPIEIVIVLDNLFSNSRKARATEVVISFNKKDDDVLELHFKDNGRGVSKPNQDKIFDFGFTTTSGSGLGLYHIQKIMKKYKGSAVINKNLKIGAEFILTFQK